MKTARNFAMTAMLGLSAWLLTALPLAAIEFDEVREYGDVFRISASAPSRDMLEVRWDIAPDYYLYNNQFLSFASSTPGVVLGEAILPKGERKFDELLGTEVIKYHGALKATVPLDSIPAGLRELVLNVRSQGCLEAVLCYPPTDQTVTVRLPAAPATSGLGSLLADPAVGSGQIVPQAGILERAAAPAQVDDAALPPEQAFSAEAIALSAETILARFTAQPGYYLYVEAFGFSVASPADVVVRSAELPVGTTKDDPEFGPVQVIRDQVEIPIRVNRPAAAEQPLKLILAYQGCRDGDICYPPQTTRVDLSLPSAPMVIDEPVTYQPPLPMKAVKTDSGSASTAMQSTTAMDAGIPFSEQDRLATLLINNPTSAIFAFFLAGILLAFTPCVFPMVPILSGIIAGEGDRLTTSRAFILSLVYVLAMAVTYTIAGVLAGLFGQNLQAVFQNPWIIIGFVAVFVALALSMFGFYELQLPSRWQTALAERSNRAEGGRLGGVAVMGFLSALIVGPCVAPPLAAALIVIGASGSAVLGGSALFALSMGMGLPLILFGVSAGKLIPRAGAWMDAVKAVFGVGLLALGVWMLERVFQGPAILVLWGLLAIGSGVFLGALESIPAGSSGWKRLWKALGLALLVVGAAELVGAAAGGDNWLKPLHRLSGGAASAEAQHVNFRRIKSVDDLDTALVQSSAAGMPAMLDFYADWCVECVRMERNTFIDPGVQALLAQLQPLQADVTPHDAVDQMLMKRFSIIGPPAILFFDRRGKEMPAYRLVGYFTPAEFSAHLQRVLAAP